MQAARVLAALVCLSLFWPLVAQAQGFSCSIELEVPDSYRKLLQFQARLQDSRYSFSFK